MLIFVYVSVVLCMLGFWSSLRLSGGGGGGGAGGKRWKRGGMRARDGGGGAVDSEKKEKKRRKTKQIIYPRLCYSFDSLLFQTPVKHRSFSFLVNHLPSPPPPTQHHRHSLALSKILSRVLLQPHCIRIFSLFPSPSSPLPFPPSLPSPFLSSAVYPPTKNKNPSSHIL